MGHTLLAVVSVAQGVHLFAWYQLGYTTRLARSCGNCTRIERFVNHCVFTMALAVVLLGTIRQQQLFLTLPTLQHAISVST